jgi:phosphoenolpyruvate---glycerone phosphotransferase subunit DhaL
MTTQVSSEGIGRMMKAAAALIRAEQKQLSELDSVAGDGDHGATMLRVVDCLERVFARDRSQDLKRSFQQAGWDVMGADGGASTSLLGVFLVGISDGLQDPCTCIDCRGLAQAFQSGLAAVQRQTKAQPGDKTMMDALAPAISALNAAAQSGDDVNGALKKAADAARSGAEATSNMVARYGRARLLGERTLGHQDAGATSVALMFAGFAQGCDSREGKS